jgi:hypothetical protein
MKCKSTKVKKGKRVKLEEGVKPFVRGEVIDLT